MSIGVLRLKLFKARSALLNTLQTGDFQKAMEEIVEKRQVRVQNRN